MRVWPQCSVWSLNAAHLIIILHFSHLRTQKVPGSSTNASSCWTVAVLRWPGPLLPTCQSFQEWPALPPRTPARRLKMENYWTTTPLLRTVALLVCSHLYTHHRMDVALKVHPSIFLHYDVEPMQAIQQWSLQIIIHLHPTFIVYLFFFSKVMTHSLKWTSRWSPTKCCEDRGTVSSPTTTYSM